MSKSLELTFLTDNGGTMTLSIPNPVEDLTLDTVKAKAEKLIPVLCTNAGLGVTALKKARILTTEAEELK